MPASKPFNYDWKLRKQRQAEKQAHINRMHRESARFKEGLEAPFSVHVFDLWDLGVKRRIKPGDTAQRFIITFKNPVNILSTIERFRVSMENVRSEGV